MEYVEGPSDAYEVKAFVQTDRPLFPVSRFAFRNFISICSSGFIGKITIRVI